MEILLVYNSGATGNLQMPTLTPSIKEAIMLPSPRTVSYEGHGGDYTSSFDTREFRLVHRGRLYAYYEEYP